MKPLEDVAINNNEDTGKRTKGETTAAETKEVIKKEPPNPSPRNSLWARMRLQTSQEP
jgi:hypothetical protein